MPPFLASRLVESSDSDDEYIPRRRVGRITRASSITDRSQSDHYGDDYQTPTAL